jgi:hypothetical protein
VISITEMVIDHLRVDDSELAGCSGCSGSVTRARYRAANAGSGMSSVVTRRSSRRCRLSS